MLRRGPISPALARFRDYEMHAADLEARKSRRGGDPDMPAMSEAALDDAWSEVEEVRRGVSAEAARAISEHFLLLRDWHEVSAGMGVPYDRCKKLAYSALRWLDGRAARQDRAHRR